MSVQCLLSREQKLAGQKDKKMNVINRFNDLFNKKTMITKCDRFQNYVTL